VDNLKKSKKMAQVPSMLNSDVNRKNGAGERGATTGELHDKQVIHEGTSSSHHALFGAMISNNERKKFLPATPIANNLIILFRHHCKKKTEKFFSGRGALNLTRSGTGVRNFCGHET
jgi:hypothetical protein